MKYVHKNNIIRIIGEKYIRCGSKGSRQWQLLKQFDGKTIEEFERAAKQATELKPSGAYQQGNWWIRELDYCRKHQVINIHGESVDKLSISPALIEDGRHVEIQPRQNDNSIMPQLSLTSTINRFRLKDKRINMNGTGIYIAYPTSPILKQIYRGYIAEVNNTHTKVGITKDSFYARKNSYIDTFDGEIEFVPIAEVKQEILKEVEQEMLGKLSQYFRKIGRTREWFNTDDREMILKVISEVFLESPHSGINPYYSSSQ